MLVKSGEVSKDQLKKINRFVPDGFPELTADQVRSVTFRVADNFVNRGQSRWSIDSLKKLADLLPGKPALKDHNHYSIDASFGKFYDAQYIESNEVDDSVIDYAGNGVENRQIFDAEGYCSVYGQAFVSSDSAILQDLSYGRVGSVSLGAFRYRDFVCPECNISLNSSKCPHALDGMYADENTPIVKYYVRSGVFDLGECSIVTIPNLPNAAII